MTSRPGPPPPPDTARPRSSRRRWIIGAVVAAVSIIVVWLAGPALWRALNRPVRPAAPEAAPAAAARRIQATLFYLSSDGVALVPTTRDVPYGETPTEQARQLLEAQVAPPPAGLESAIPRGTTVRAVYLTLDDKAYVDLGGAIVSGHTGGSLDEALTVYTIVDVVTANLRNVSAVQILVNGKQVDTLVGHVDLRYPLTPAPAWIRKGP